MNKKELVLEEMECLLIEIPKDELAQTLEFVIGILKDLPDSKYNDKK